MAVMKKKQDSYLAYADTRAMAKRHADSDAESVPLLDDSLNLNETFISHQRE